MKRLGWMKHRLAVFSQHQHCWEKYQQPQVCRWYHSNGRKWKETKETLEGERGEWKSFKLNIEKTKIMASDHTITWCQIEGRKVEAVTDFTFLGSQITADGDCSHDIKRHLLHARKSMTNLVLVAQSCLTFVTPGLYPTRLFCPWNSPGKKTGIVRYSLF